MWHWKRNDQFVPIKTDFGLNGRAVVLLSIFRGGSKEKSHFPNVF